MIDNHHFEGYWEFSNDRDNFYSGVLHYDVSNRTLDLKLWGKGNNEHRLDFEKDTILGYTTDGYKLTLLNCIIRKQIKKLE